MRCLSGERKQIQDIWRDGARVVESRHTAQCSLAMIEQSILLHHDRKDQTNLTSSTLPSPITHYHHLYSLLSEFTGLVLAAFTDSKLTVIHAMSNAATNAMTKIVQSMVM